MKMLYIQLRLFVVTFFSLIVSQSAFSSGTLAPEFIVGTSKITAEGLFELVEKFEDLVIIDARKPDDRDKGYIEGSIGLPDTETTEISLAKHLSSKATPVIFYCNGPKCGRSVKSSKMAVEWGYKNIYWFRGGWKEWTEKGLPVTKD